jgi:hypothetical protein
MASGGTYRIQGASLNKEFPAPPTTTWDEQAIGSRLSAAALTEFR